MHTISAFWGGFYVFFILWSTCSHIIFHISSHLVVRINYLCTVSSSTTQLLLNWLSINLSFGSILSSLKIFHTSIVVWLLRKFECRICIVTYLIPIYFSHPTQFNIYQYLPQLKFLFYSELKNIVVTIFVVRMENLLNCWLCKLKSDFYQSSKTNMAKRFFCPTILFRVKSPSFYRKHHRYTLICRCLASWKV